ncbi:MAG TPA: alpha/beta fold hydrolase [Gemmatimonadota bacterium]|nr:alpha/beta fold hydrolase [Gemmatimonadota bacterium]
MIFIEDWAQDTSTWFRILPLLRPGRQLVRYDLRGQGRSGIPADGDYSLEAHVEDLFRLFDGLAIDRAHLVASGLGARVAITAAAGSPDRIRSLTLLNPHTAWSRAELEGWERFLEAYERVGRPTLGEYAAFLVDGWVAPPFARREPWLIPFYDLVLRRQDPEALVAALRAWLSSDLALDAAATLDIPLLVVRGGHAGGVSGEARLRSAFPRYGAVILPESGRFPQLEAPARLGKAIAERIEPAAR